MNVQTPDDPPLLAAARAGLDEVIALRRQLHRRPEIGLHLPETQAVVAETLRGMGLEPRLGGTTTSVVATIDGERPGPTILLRADMDGLPLTETTGLPFASEIDGTMHACGHDTHVAMLLGAARLLVERRSDLAGRVLLMFQPGEEGYHGARFMLEEGLLEEGPYGAAGVTEAVALHISTMFPTGTVHLRPGALLASADRIVATVHGRGGHASTPHLALDPMPTAAALVLALQVAVTRGIDIFDPAVVTITRMSGGTTNNIIPESVEIEGTIRTLSSAGRGAVHDLIRRVADGVAATYGTTIDLEIVPGYPVTMCDPAVVTRVRNVAVGLIGEAAVSEMPDPIMGAEDFAYVLDAVPGMMAFIGARPTDEDPAIAPMNHSDRVVFDESAMAVGVALYAGVALDALSD